MLFAAALLTTFGLALMPARALAIPSVPEGVAWGGSSRALLDALGARASVLARPIDFGDAYADVVLRDASLGGVAMTAFFQMIRRAAG